MRRKAWRFESSPGHQELYIVDKKLKAIQRMAGIVVFNTNKPAYIHYDENTLKFIVSTKSTRAGSVCIEKVTEGIVPCVNVTITEVFPQNN